MSESFVYRPTNFSEGPHVATVARKIGRHRSHQLYLESGVIAYVSQVTLTRPSNTTLYTAGDAMTDTSGNAREFFVARELTGGGGIISQAFCQNLDGNEATKPDLELWLLNSTTRPASAGDNAAFTISDTNVAKVICVISFNVASWITGAPGTPGGNSFCRGFVLGRDPRVPYVTASVDGTIYGLVVVRNAYTPLSDERFVFSLYLEQN